MVSALILAAKLSFPGGQFGEQKLLPGRYLWYKTRRQSALGPRLRGIKAEFTHMCTY